MAFPSLLVNDLQWRHTSHVAKCNSGHVCKLECGHNSMCSNFFSLKTFVKLAAEQVLAPNGGSNWSACPLMILRCCVASWCNCIAVGTKSPWYTFSSQWCMQGFPNFAVQRVAVQLSSSSVVGHEAPGDAGVLFQSSNPLYRPLQKIRTYFQWLLWTIPRHAKDLTMGCQAWRGLWRLW